MRSFLISQWTNILIIVLVYSFLHLKGQYSFFFFFFFLNLKIKVKRIVLETYKFFIENNVLNNIP